MRHLKYLLWIAVLATSCQTFEPPVDEPLKDIPGVNFDFKGKNVNFNTTDDSYFNYTWIENLGGNIHVLNSELRSEDCLNACANSFRFSALVSQESRDKMLADPEMELKGELVTSIDTFGGAIEYTFTINKFASFPVQSIIWTIHDYDSSPMIYTDVDSVFILDENRSVFCVEVAMIDILGNYSRSMQDLRGLGHYGSEAPYVSYQRTAGGIDAQINFPNDPFFFFDQFNEPSAFIPSNHGDSVFVSYFELEGGRMIEEFFINDLDSSGQLASLSAQLVVDSDLRFSLMGSMSFIDYSMSYLDENNELWISINDPISSVEVVDVKKFVDNEFGDPTILMELSINAVFISATQQGESAIVTDGTVFIALPL